MEYVLDCRSVYWGAGGYRESGQVSNSPPLSSPREEESRENHLGWEVHSILLPLDVLGLGFVPCLFILPPRVPSVLRAITENSDPHPFKLQAVKRLGPLRKLCVAPLSRKLLFCSLIFSLF